MKWQLSFCFIKLLKAWQQKGNSSNMETDINPSVASIWHDTWVTAVRLKLKNVHLSWQGMPTISVAQGSWTYRGATFWARLRCISRWHTIIFFKNAFHLNHIIWAWIPVSSIRLPCVIHLLTPVRTLESSLQTYQNPLDGKSLDFLSETNQLSIWPGLLKLSGGTHPRGQLLTYHYQSNVERLVPPSLSPHWRAAPQVDLIQLYFHALSFFPMSLSLVSFILSSAKIGWKSV